MYLDDRVRLTKYYGLVPRDLFEAAFYEGENEDRPTDEEFEDYSPYVEAIVIIANGGTLLKIEENPYMMQDRPVVAFPWDVVPSRFWGRGICEKDITHKKPLTLN